MQLGGIDTGHSVTAHQVTGCLHEHTESHKLSGGLTAADAASRAAQLQQQEQQQTAQFSLSAWMEKTLGKGRGILRGILGTAGEADVSEENGSEDFARPSLTQEDNSLSAAEVVGSLNASAAAHQAQLNPYFQPVEQTPAPHTTPVQKLRAKIREAASQLADHLPGRFFGSHGKNSLQTKQEQQKEDLRRRSRYKKDETEIDCILTDESYLMDSYDRKGEYTQLTTKK